MFSYRHAFHAGNHADVLKHLVLLECLKYLQKKEVGLTLIDTHAGAGLYELQSGYASISAEANQGILKLNQYSEDHTIKSDSIKNYIETIQRFNTNKHDLTIYPGSPALMAKALRPQDKLRLFELHTSDFPLLENNIHQMHAQRQTQITFKDGFDGLKSLLPPQSRRGLILIDPSYEDKNDYRKVLDSISDSLKRFATGTYAIWYPYLSRIDSQELPERLKELGSDIKDYSWLHTRLDIKPLSEGEGLCSSGMFIINPPWTLKKTLEDSLPELCEALSEDYRANFILEHHLP